MLKLLITLSLIIFCTLAKAQIIVDSTPIDVSNIDDTLKISSKVSLFIDSSSSLIPSRVLNEKFVPLKHYNYTPGHISVYQYYLKFSVVNRSNKSISVYLFPGILYNKVKIFKIKDTLEESIDTETPYGFARLRLLPKEECEVLVYLYPVKSENISINPILIKESFITGFSILIWNKDVPKQVLGYVVSGLLLMMCLFMITNYVFNKKKEFLYNSLYCLCVFLLTFFSSVAFGVITPFSVLFLSFLDFFLLIMGGIFYLAFIRYFLNTKLYYKRLDKIFLFQERFIFCLLLVYTCINFFTDLYIFQIILRNVVKLLLLGLGIFFIFLALKQKNKLINYIAIGNSALILFSIISLALFWIIGKGKSIFVSSLFYYYVGVVCEIFFFLLGLTYKNKKELIEKIRDKEALKLEAEKANYEAKIAIIKAQQEMRNKISADMHDDLGAGMTSIRLYSEIAKTKLGNNLIPEIGKISASSKELLSNMNAIIWSMGTSNDSLANMMAYIRNYCMEYFENTSIKCKVIIPEEIPDIEIVGEIRRNIFLVIKEALNNTLKHSKATEVTLTLEKCRNEFLLHIYDNGTGINMDKLRQFGNGLKNMKKRMLDIEAAFRIENKNGTLITLHKILKRQ